MGRKLMRVPMDFDYPLGQVWEGYLASLDSLKANEGIVQQVPEILQYEGNVCQSCTRTFNECSEEARYCVWYNESLRPLWFHEPPKGEGYQLWETTTEGSPQSPVFATLEALCAWCAEHATVFADQKVSKEQWMQMLGDDFVYHQEGNAIFL